MLALCLLCWHFAYYAGIMPDAFGCLLCSLLCWNNWLELSEMQLLGGTTA